MVNDALISVTFYYSNAKETLLHYDALYDVKGLMQTLVDLTNFKSGQKCREVLDWTYDLTLMLLVAFFTIQNDAIKAEK